MDTDNDETQNPSTRMTMNKLLKQQGLYLFFTLFGEILILGVLVGVYFFFPDFAYYFYLWIGATFLFLVVDFDTALYFNIRADACKGRAEITSAEILGNDIDEAYNFGKIGLAVCDRNNVVLWVNNFLQSRFPDMVDMDIQKVILDANFQKILQDFRDSNSDSSSQSQDLLDSTLEGLPVKVDNFTYIVKIIKEGHLFVFRDISPFQDLLNSQLRQKPVVGYIAVDNYSDVQMKIRDDVQLMELTSHMKNAIVVFGKTYQCLMRAIRDDRYLFITTNENYLAMKNDNWELLDEVRGSDDNGFTLSIGLACGTFSGYTALSDSANSALNTALTRGGDQVVVASSGKALEFFGGKSEQKPTRNRVEYRTKVNSLLSIMQAHDNILIMGHANADFDSVGSCLGLYLLAQFAHKDARICWDDLLVEENARVAIQGQFTPEEMSSRFVNLKGAEQFIESVSQTVRENGERRGTLLILADHNSPDQSMFANVVNEVSNIAVMDHHRPSVHLVSEMIFNGIDSSASSASELVTEYLMYSDQNIFIDPRTATFLLAGISLDTNHFSKKETTDATFEAAAKLVSSKANVGQVDDFLKESFEEYRQMIDILGNNATPYNDTIIETAKEIVPKEMLAKVAALGLQMRGLSLSICLGRLSENEVGFSARSDGTISCQKLMEKMGGGGRFDAAATVLADTTLDDARKRLDSILKDYRDEARADMKSEDDAGEKEDAS
jgi:cyclic-di-AMP phosphodiesterase